MHIPSAMTALAALGLLGAAVGGRDPSGGTRRRRQRECANIGCGLNCTAPCGWSSKSNACRLGGKTLKFERWRGPSCPEGTGVSKQEKECRDRTPLYRLAKLKDRGRPMPTTSSPPRATALRLNHSTIPRLIHRVFLCEHTNATCNVMLEKSGVRMALPSDPGHDLFAGAALDRCHKLNPGWTAVDWDAMRVDGLIAEHFGPAVKARYDSLPLAVQRADLARILILA